MIDQPNDTRLWCLHHIGPDEVHPAPDFATAQRWVDWANTTFAEHADISRFVVAVWPWSAEKHRNGLKWAIMQWTLSERSAATCNDRLQVGAGVKDGLTTAPVGLRDDVPRYVKEFLAIVFTAPGHKISGLDFQDGWCWDENNPDAPQVEPSWAIAEKNGWAEAVGSYKWVITESGKDALFGPVATPARTDVAAQQAEEPA